jgi:hypothetical protein
VREHLLDSDFKKSIWWREPVTNFPVCRINIFQVDSHSYLLNTGLRPTVGNRDLESMHPSVTVFPFVHSSLSYGSLLSRPYGSLP